MGRALNAHKIWGRSYAWFRLWVDLAQIRGLFVGVDRGRYGEREPYQPGKGHSMTRCALSSPWRELAGCAHSVRLRNGARGGHVCP